MRCLIRKVYELWIHVAISIVEGRPWIRGTEPFRFDDEKVGSQLDFPVGVSRSLLEVGDDAVRGKGGIDSEEDFSSDVLVGAGRAEGLRADEIGSRVHVDANDFCGQRRSDEANQ